MNKEEYREYLQSPSWQSKRQSFIESSNSPNRCLICRMFYPNIQVHHNTYKNVGNERNRDLSQLCPDCHKTIHNNFKFGAENNNVVKKIAEKIYEFLEKSKLYILQHENKKKYKKVISRQIKKVIKKYFRYHPSYVGGKKH